MTGTFRGDIRRDVRDSTPDWGPFQEPQAPAGAPNVLFVVWDDMGFGSWDLFGGALAMPNMRRLADAGITMSQFHTTALCSPTRASLLTGRTATSSGMSVIGEMAEGFPNMSCVIPPENGFVSEVLREAGYNTMAIGKWHLCPAGEMSMGASKRTWPLQRGFDRFYGFLGGLTDQWYPDLWYDNHQIEPPTTPDEGYHLSADLADKAIEFVTDSLTTAPTKPWMMYFCPGACHAPHHVFSEWADRYRGVFDDGYEHYRENVLARQIELGLIPAGTTLPDINPLGHETSADGTPWLASDIVRPWDELGADEQRLLARQAEVFAGYASYTDAQIGRLLDHLEHTGQLDNTIVVALSDNGCSAEGGPAGSVNENRYYNGVEENLTENLRHLDELGTPSSHPHFSNGWAMAFNTPFKLYKTNAAWEGGTADPAIISWPAGLGTPGRTCEAYLQVADLVPTLYDLLGIEPPATVRSVAQTPLEGVSMAAVLRDPQATSPKTTQFYSMFGTRAIWHQGWQANTTHAPAPSGWSHFEKDRWCLYHLESDRNQLHDLATDEPDRLQALIALWEEQAELYQGYPLYDRSVPEIVDVVRPAALLAGNRLTMYPGGAEVPERAFEIISRSFAIEADIDVHTSTDGDPDGEGPARGIVYAAGGRFGGHALYLHDGRLHYTYNWLGEREQHLTAAEPLTPGRHQVSVEFLKTGHDGPSPTGTATLAVDGHPRASDTITIQPAYFSLAGEGANVGRDRGQPVSSAYTPPFTLTGATVAQVTLARGDDAAVDLIRQNEADFHRD